MPAATETFEDEAPGRIGIVIERAKPGDIALRQSQGTLLLAVGGWRIQAVSPDSGRLRPAQGR